MDEKESVTTAAPEVRQWAALAEAAGEVPSKAACAQFINASNVRNEPTSLHTIR
jgi:hypothetical protein